MGRSLRRARARASICAAALAVALGGCKAKSTNPDDYVIDTAPFSEAVGPETYVPKVKNLLTGLPATDAELRAVIADPGALRGLIDQWMTTPEFKGRMLDFFRNAFQQNNVTMGAITSSLGTNDTYLDGGQRDRLQWAIMDSFPLTAWQIVQEGRPFTETVTTRRYMMTTAMMSLLGYLDMFDVDDRGDRTDRLNEITSMQLVFDPLATDTTYEESLAAFRPGGSGPWLWHIPVRNLTPECEAFIRAGRATDPAFGMNVPSSWETSAVLFGYVFGNAGFDPGNGLTTVCRERYDWSTQTAYNAPIPIVRDDLAVDDFDDWRLVTIEQIPISQADTLPAPLFWDLPALRAATTLQLKSPHVGFLGTLAWLANWPTNESNQARVTANQALIASLGLSIIPAAAIAPAPVTASDRAHSTDPACAACHLVLDPLRQFFRQSYTFSYHEQRDLTQYLGDAAFLLGGMNVTGRGVGDLAIILASHPHFAVGWAQKLQFWANSAAANEDDPELQRIGRVFAASHFDFKVLVREVFSSPLVTLARGTATYRSAGVTVGIARRDQLCARLSSRLGVPDVCDQRDGPDWGLRGRAQMIATDTYYRAAELPALPRDPDLFFRASVEAMCERVAANVVDSGAAARYTSTPPASVNAAIADMVATIMGIPAADAARSAAAIAVLTKHYNDADAVASAQASLRSTFILACSSPSSVLNGL